jgi:transcriptional regulator with XRE-family HTH domain
MEVKAKKRAPGKSKKVDPVKALLVKLKKIRLDRGLTAKELAEKAGCSDSTIHAYERGDSIPKLATFVKIVDALGYEIVLNMK